MMPLMPDNRNVKDDMAWAMLELAKDPNVEACMRAQARIERDWDELARLLWNNNTLPQIKALARVTGINCTGLVTKKEFFQVAMQGLVREIYRQEGYNPPGGIVGMLPTPQRWGPWPKEDDDAETDLAP